LSGYIIVNQLSIDGTIVTAQTLQQIYMLTRLIWLNW